MLCYLSTLNNNVQNTTSKTTHLEHHCNHVTMLN